ncbi:MAG: hypothetical protein M0R80_28780 [Proteobacteria bacterium]|jgi:hypothetical protein|nr:hypothetical protein [Pseudomonadota bacterium]
MAKKKAKRKFLVSYTFGATIMVEADSEEDAEAKVEDMPVEDLFDKNCQDGFEVSDATELEE